MRGGWAFLPVLLAPAAALAQVDLHNSTRLSLGATDNARGAPVASADPALPPAPGPQASSMITFSDTLGLHYQGGLTNHGLANTVTVTRFAPQVNGTSVSDALSSSNAFELGPAVKASLSLAGIYARQQVLDLYGQLPPEDLGVRAPGSRSFVNGTATQTLSWELDARWTLSESASALAYRPLDQALVLQQYTGLGAGLQLQWSGLTNVLRASVGGSLRRRFELQADAMVHARYPNATQAMASWDHELMPGLISVLEAGAIGTRRDGLGRPIVTPSGRAELRLTVEDFEARAGVSRTMRSSLLYGDLFITDLAEIHAQLALGPNHRWVLGGGAAASRARAVSQLVWSFVNLYTAGGELSYRPTDRFDLSLGASYQYSYQQRPSGSQTIFAVTEMRRQLAVLSVSVGLPAGRGP